MWSWVETCSVGGGALEHKLLQDGFHLEVILYPSVSVHCWLNVAYFHTPGVWGVVTTLFRPRTILQRKSANLLSASSDSSRRGDLGRASVTHVLTGANPQTKVGELQFYICSFNHHNMFYFLWNQKMSFFKRCVLLSHTGNDSIVPTHPVFLGFLIFISNEMY